MALSEKDFKDLGVQIDLIRRRGCDSAYDADGVGDVGEAIYDISQVLNILVAEIKRLQPFDPEKEESKKETL